MKKKSARKGLNRVPVVGIVGDGRKVIYAVKTVKREVDRHAAGSGPKRSV